MNDRERAAYEAMRAFQDARDLCAPGSKEWKQLDLEFKKADFEYHKVRD